MPGFFDASPGPGTAKPILGKARFSTRANEKPAHRAAMPGFFDASPGPGTAQPILGKARFSAFLVKNPHIAQRCRVSLMPPLAQERRS